MELAQVCKRRYKTTVSCATTALALSSVHDFQEAQFAQTRLLPKAIPQIDGFRMAGFWRPAGAFSGDGYDVWRISDKSVGLCVGDVCGKGLPAALVMSGMQTAVRTTAVQRACPAVACDQLNRVMCNSVLPGRFVSLFYAVLRGLEGRLLYTNAGHPPPILVRHDTGFIERLTAGGPLIGLFEHASYEQREIEFRPGDRLLMYTDGASELTNAEGEEFGDGRLIDVITHNRTKNADQIQAGLVSALSDFGGGYFDDDVTFLVVAAD